MATQKNHNNLLVIEPKDIEICGLPKKKKNDANGGFKETQ